MSFRQPHIASLPSLLRAVSLVLAVGIVMIGPAEAKPAGAPGDPDGDGLTNKEEAFWGGDPQDADTDDDGLGDGDEVRLYFTWPNDPDSDDDGLTDAFEVTLGTLPYDADTDDDGYLDGVDRYPLRSNRH